jgi:hypothetical protein
MAINQLDFEDYINLEYKLYNLFLFPWKVPSMNELMYMKGITGKKSWLLKSGPKAGKSTDQRGFIYNRYNEMKQEWSQKVRINVVHQGFTPVESCYFNYLIIENNIKRDPSNIFASAIKFVEDGLQEANVIPNDGWKNVKGIRPYVHLDRESSCALMLAMTNQPLGENTMVSYYNTWKTDTTNRINEKR